MSPISLPTWYVTPTELAELWKCSVDRVLYWIDAGLMTPAALVPKAQLPFARPGPSPYVVVLLDCYASMAWRAEGGDMVAPLVGEFRAYQVERDGFVSLTIAGCDDVSVARSQLVLPIDQLEELTDLATKQAAMRSDERRTFLLILGALLADTDAGEKHYAIGESVATVLFAAGVDMNVRTIASKVREAIDAFSDATRNKRHSVCDE